MTLWLAVGAMTLVAVVMLVWPLLRRGTSDATPSRAQYDLEIYRDQLAELDRERAAGRISADQDDAARAEIGRRMLRAADAAGDQPKVAGRRAGHRVAALFAAVVPLAALLLYHSGGSPHLPGRPASETVAARDEAVARERQAAQLVEDLRARLGEQPEDARGWRLLGRAEARLGKFEAAARAYERALKFSPADADLWSRHGEALTFASEGTVTPRAVESFAAALLVESSEPRARFYLGIADLQAGRRRSALAWWLSLEAESQPDAPWMGTLAARIDRVAASLNLDPAALRRNPPAQPAPPPAGAAGTAVKEAQAAQDRRIRSMVARLAKRLESEPDNADGWLRLGRSYQVLGEIEKSRAAYGRAAALRPDDPAVQSRYAASILRTLKSGDAPPRAFHKAIAAALTTDPGFPNALWLAGMVAERRGRNREAAAYWRRLLSQLKPDAPERAELLRRIEELGAAR